jgi:hypothetical protein
MAVKDQHLLDLQAAADEARTSMILLAKAAILG